MNWHWFTDKHHWFTDKASLTNFQSLLQLIMKHMTSLKRYVIYLLESARSVSKLLVIQLSTDYICYANKIILLITSAYIPFSFNLISYHLRLHIVLPILHLYVYFTVPYNSVYEFRDTLHSYEIIQKASSVSNFCVKALQ